MTARSFLLCAALLSGSQPAFAAAPSNDRVNRATTVSSLPFQDVLNTSAATTSMNDPACVGQGPTVWFRYRASQDGPVTANTAQGGNRQPRFACCRCVRLSWR